MFAGATTTVTLLETTAASAAGGTNVTVSVEPGSDGFLYFDSAYSGCGEGGAYDAGYDYDATGVNFTPHAGYSLPPTQVPTNGPGCGTKTLNLIRAELYPFGNRYDIWSGNIGGAAVQRTTADGSDWKNFGTIPLPTIGKLDAFRIEGNIVSSDPAPMPDGRLKIELFQVGCGYPDTCIPLKPTLNSTAVAGAFAAGYSKGHRWSGSVGWPGLYKVYVEDTLTGRKVGGFMDIVAGPAPDIDLNAPCFGMLTCIYYTGGVTTPPAGGFHELPPTRILDTRPEFKIGIDNGAMTSGDGRSSAVNPVTRRFQTANHELKVTGVAGIPLSGVSAVLLNVTAVTPPGGDWLSVTPRPPGYGTDIYDDQNSYGPFPNTSNLNLTQGETVPNLVLARVGAGGTIRFWNAGFGNMHVIADVAGWFDTSATTPVPQTGGLRFTGIAPDRLLDTRPTFPGTNNRFVPGDDRELLVAGFHNVPADAKSVVVNITSVTPTKVGYVTAYPNGKAVPNASNLNVNPGITRSNLAVVKVGTDGKIRLKVFESDMDLIVDVMGYYGGTGGGLTTAITPVRVVDSRDGTGTPAGRFAQCESRNVKVAGVFGIPSGITAVYLNLTAADTDNGGYLTVWPAGLTMPATSNLNWDPFRNTPNMVIVGVNPDGFISIANGCNPAGTNVSVIVDLFGYVK